MTQTLAPDYLTIRQMCDRFGVTARALRFYETKDLLAPMRRGAERLYSARESAQLALILKGKRLGFALSEIRRMMGFYESPDAGPHQLAEALRAAEARRTALLAESERLARAISEIEDDIAALVQRLGPQPHSA